ncbi:MAG: hypothetical protein COT85_07955 [Chlamydiae bacterium CG10_big_fil_rev_8_21_14_0_10_42_34]|nr:MAG: hypothetical protein COT85_07955 [Chlamydiae bacterium CG10_big_fil_rev_8_21_14_0_10_42_34]
MSASLPGISARVQPYCDQLKAKATSTWKYIVDTTEPTRTKAAKVWAAVCEFFATKYAEAKASIQSLCNRIRGIDPDVKQTIPPKGPWRLWS